MASAKRWGNVPGMELHKITKEFLRSPTGQKLEKERQEREERKLRLH